MNQGFHPSGLGVSIKEKEEDFTFIFKVIKDGIYKIHGVEFKPSTFVADAAPAIRNGFKMYSVGIFSLLALAQLNK